MLFWKTTNERGTYVQYSPVVSIAESHSTMDYEIILASGQEVIFNKVPDDGQTQLFLAMMSDNQVHVI